MTSTPIPPDVMAANMGIGGRVEPKPDRAMRTIVLVGVPLVTALFVMTALDFAGMAMWWENGHWTLTASMAVALAAAGARATSGIDRKVRTLGAAALTVYLAGQLLWDGQVAAGVSVALAPSDFLYLGMVVPFVVALVVAVRAHASRGEVRTFFLDVAVLAAAITAGVFYLFASEAVGALDGLGVVLLLYPILYLGLSGAVIVAALLNRSAVAPRGLYLAALGMALLGGDWAWYLASAVHGQPTTGSLVNMLGSVGSILTGLGVATWHTAPSPSERLERRATQLVAFLPVGAIGFAAAILVLSEVGPAGISLVESAILLVIVAAIVRQTLLLGDQTAFLERERRASERERDLREGVQRALSAAHDPERVPRAPPAPDSTPGVDAKH